MFIVTVNLHVLKIHLPSFFIHFCSVFWLAASDVFYCTKVKISTNQNTPPVNVVKVKECNLRNIAIQIRIKFQLLLNVNGMIKSSVVGFLDTVNCVLFVMPVMVCKNVSSGFSYVTWDWLVSPEWTGHLQEEKLVSKGITCKWFPIQ